MTPGPDEHDMGPIDPDTLGLVIRAEIPHSASTPARVYWNTTDSIWGPFSEATRYPLAADPRMLDSVHAQAAAVLGVPQARIETIADLPRDLDGYYYQADADGHGQWRVTDCCAVPPSISDGPLYCRSCYEAVEEAVQTPARLDANWQPGDGPVRINLS